MELSRLASRSINFGIQTASISSVPATRTCPNASRGASSLALLTIVWCTVFAHIDVHAIVENRAMPSRLRIKDPIVEIHVLAVSAVSASKHRFRWSKLHQYPSVSRRSSAVRTGKTASRGCRSQRDLVSTLQLLSGASHKYTSCLCGNGAPQAKFRNLHITGLPKLVHFLRELAVADIVSLATSFRSSLTEVTISLSSPRVPRFFLVGLCTWRYFLRDSYVHFAPSTRCPPSTGVTRPSRAARCSAPRYHPRCLRDAPLALLQRQQLPRVAQPRLRAALLPSTDGKSPRASRPSLRGADALEELHSLHQATNL